MPPPFAELYRYVSGVKAPVHEAPRPPMLFASTAAGLSILYTVIYVLPFYLHPTTRPSPKLCRDSSTVIRTRVQLVTLSVALSTFITTVVLSRTLRLSRYAILHTFGLYPTPLLSTFVFPCLLTACLFAGPLFERTIVDGGWREWITLRPLFESLNSWIAYRNYIAGPLTEEILFRALILSLHIHTPPPHSSSLFKDVSAAAAQQYPQQQHKPPSLAILVFVTPLYFGIAHVHHCYERRLTHPYTPFLPILLASVMQFAYTTVFGWYAAFLFLRTGNLWTVVVVHAFCNWMGLPRLWGRVGGEIAEMMAAGVDEGNGNGHGRDEAVRGKEDREVKITVRKVGGDGHDGTSPRGQQLGLGWTLLYYVILTGGAVGWWMYLWPWTESKGALVEFPGVTSPKN